VAPSGCGRPYEECRAEVIDLADEGGQFGELEDLIGAAAALSEEERSALWLYAWSLCGSDAHREPGPTRTHEPAELLTGGGRQGSLPEVPWA
jgi:hypothetical protein